MSMSLLETQRHYRERGDILRTLKEDYSSAMTSTRNLLGALDAQGISLSEQGLTFHLHYLEDAGYIRVSRVRDMPNFRNDRRSGSWMKPDTIMFARLMPKGLHLVDGAIREDPGVVF
jgi:DNA-binding transcriptional ArsR family regulator